MTFIPFDQHIPSNDTYTNFLLDILDDLKEGKSVTLDENQKSKLEEILVCSFDQIILLDQEEENTPPY